MISKVTYIDYAEDAFDEGNFLTPFLHKRQSFQHEQELRAIVSGWPDYDKTGALRFQDFDDGKKVPVDLHTLADSIFISPTTSSWFRLLVESLSHQYGYTFAVKQSDLDSDPVY